MRGRSSGRGRCLAAYRPSRSGVWRSERADPALRCEILKGLGATFYGSLAEYDGAACLKSWEEKSEGEIGPLVKYPAMNRIFQQCHLSGRPW